MHSTRIDSPIREFTEHFLRCSDMRHSLVVLDVLNVIAEIDQAVENGRWSATRDCWKKLDELIRPLCEAEQLAFLPEVQQLRLYEDYEKSLRTGRVLSLPEMRHVLHLKSCDISMYRRVLSFRLARPVPSGVFTRLRAIDLLRELLDDLRDVEEDLQKPNFNFLIQASRTTCDPYCLVSSELNTLTRHAISSLQAMAAKGWVDERSSAFLEAAIFSDEVESRERLPSECNRIKCHCASGRVPLRHVG